LSCGRSPSAVMLLIDGMIVGLTGEFQPRADVSAAMHSDAASAWRVSANLWGVPPGERVLQLAVRLDAHSHFRIVREQRGFVHAQPPPSETASGPLPTDGELAAMATQAAARLREHQTDYGAWLTAYTPTLRYEAP